MKISTEHRDALNEALDETAGYEGDVYVFDVKHIEILRSAVIAMLEDDEQIATVAPAVDAQPAWISVDAEKPRAEWDKYYEDDFSEPVAVMIDYNGHHRRSEMTWRYSFAHGGWVVATLADGYKPSDYMEYGTVTHWAPLPAALSQKAGEQQ